MTPRATVTARLAASSVTLLPPSASSSLTILAHTLRPMLSAPRPTGVLPGKASGALNSIPYRDGIVQIVFQLQIPHLQRES